jgi:hypothetical protein
MTGSRYAATIAGTEAWSAAAVGALAARLAIGTQSPRYVIAAGARSRPNRLLAAGRRENPDVCAREM